MRIVLPWPSPALSPNARNHWAQTAYHKKYAREEARIETLAQLHIHHRMKLAESEGKIPCRITFFPPDNRRRDDDNMVASFKAARDGIADALHIDDRRLRPHYFFEDAAKPGRVEVCFG